MFFSHSFLPFFDSSPIMLFSFFLTALFAGSTLATPVVYDGRAPLTLTEQDIDTSKGPFLRYDGSRM